MDYQNFNIHLDEYLQKTLQKLFEENLLDNENIYIEMYYQGFNDAISLLTKTFK